MEGEEYNNPIERPIECSECKKQTCVKYTELTSIGLTRTIMCEDCPFLAHHIKGEEEGEQLHSHEAGLCCGTCGTTLNSLRTGSSLGCPECYEVFSMPLIQELLKADQIPEKMKEAALRGSQTLHKGHTLGEIKEVSPSLRLLALNEALNETLSREDYEQAAWLRDQIKELMTEEEKEDDEL